MSISSKKASTDDGSPMMENYVNQLRKANCNHPIDPGQHFKALDVAICVESEALCQNEW